MFRHFTFRGFKRCPWVQSYAKNPSTPMSLPSPSLKTDILWADVYQFNSHDSRTFLLVLISVLCLPMASLGAFSCREVLDYMTSIYIGSELGIGEASEEKNFVIDLNGPNVDLNLDISAVQSKTPHIIMENKGGVIGNIFIDPKRSKDIPDFKKKVGDPEYHNQIHPAKSVLQELTQSLTFLLDDFLQSPKSQNLDPDLLIAYGKIMGILSQGTPPIVLRPNTDPVFQHLPKDRIAATRINEPGATIYFNKDLLTWGEYRIVDFNKLKFGPSKMGSLLNSNDENDGHLSTLQFDPFDVPFSEQTSKTSLISWIRLLIHELGHQVGLTDDSGLTPDQLAAPLESFFERQIQIHELELEQKRHPWAKIIEIQSLQNPGRYRLLALDLNGLTDLTPSIRRWVQQIYPDLKAEQVWMSNLHIKSSSGWDVFNLATPFILSGKLMIKKQVGTLLQRDAELILFYGAENSIADSNFNQSTWAREGLSPELIYGPEHESIMQMRLLPLGTDSLQKFQFVMHSQWPQLRVKPSEQWQMMLESDSLPRELEPLSAKFNVRPSKLRHNVWFRHEEPIQLAGRWETVGGKTFLHLEFQPGTPIKPGPYFIETIEGEFKNRETGKRVTMEIKTSDRLSVTVVPEPNPSEASVAPEEPLVLKRFGTMMVKVVDRKDELRWIALNANIHLTWQDHKNPLAKTEIISGWVPVPFVFNRPFNPKHLWLHGSAVVKNANGQEVSLLFSGPVEQLPMVVRGKRVYQNKSKETVLELEMHRPLTLNNFEFVKWNLTGMTIVENNLDVSYQRLHMYFGNITKDDNKGDKN